MSFLVSCLCLSLLWVLVLHRNEELCHFFLLRVISLIFTNGTSASEGGGFLPAGGPMERYPLFSRCDICALRASKIPVRNVTLVYGSHGRGPYVHYTRVEREGVDTRCTCYWARERTHSYRKRERDTLMHTRRETKSDHSYIRIQTDAHRDVARTRARTHARTHARTLASGMEMFVIVSLLPICHTGFLGQMRQP